MGICHHCYQQSTNETLESIKTLSFKAGPEFNAINFTFTNRPLHQLKGDCVILYADHTTELSKNKVFNSIHKKMKRKICQYLILAEQQLERNSTKHVLIPISITAFKFKTLMFVKMQPWDGQSKKKIEQKIYDLTVGYLQSFKLRKIKSFTIAQFDLFSGIHYSISFPPISKAIQRYSSDIRSVTILCNSVEAIDYYHRNLRVTKKSQRQLEKKQQLDSKTKSRMENLQIEEQKLF